MSLCMTFIYLSFIKLIFFVSFQHKTCLKSSRSEKSLSVRLAVLDFHTSACFFFFFTFRLPYVLGGKRTLHCSYGRRVIVYPCACEGLRVHKMYTQHSYTTHCVIACEGLCVCGCVSGRCRHHAKSSLLILLVRLRTSPISPTLWPPGTGSPEGRV